ncbi:MAG: M15 family metallopeptidase [Actinomycetota bacterium]
MKKPVVLIAPGIGLFLIGSLMLIALTAFRMPPSDAEVRVAGNAPAQALPALTAAPRAELIGPVLGAARGRAEVSAAAEIRSGTRWINAWAADGGPATGPPPGLTVPVDAASVNPEDFSKLVPQSLRAKIEELAGGGAILSRTGAGLRGINSSGVVQFGATSIPVIGVVEDAYLRNHEIVVSHSTGDAIGLTETRYLVIGLKEIGAGKAVEDAIRAGIPPGTFMRMRGPEGSGASSQPSPLLPLAQIKAIFGEFSAVNGAGGNIGIDPAWIEANTEMASIPLLGTFRCHVRMIPQIAAAFQEVEEQGLAGLIRQGDFGGCFSPRYIRSGKEAGLSRHAWGIAFDFNVSGNLYGQPPTMDMRLVEIMERHGFSWGGRWNYPDGMHFEYISEPRP